MYSRGAAKIMMFDFSQYELDELYEARDALNKEIQEKEFKLRDIQFEQEEKEHDQEAMEEWRDSSL